MLFRSSVTQPSAPCTHLAYGQVARDLEADFVDSAYNPLWTRLAGAGGGGCPAPGHTPR